MLFQDYFIASVDFISLLSIGNVSLQRGLYFAFKIHVCLVSTLWFLHIYSYFMLSYLIAVYLILYDSKNTFRE
jgi:hypothetical protein